MKKRGLLLLLVLTIVIYQLSFVYSQSGMNIGLTIVEFDSDNDGTADGEDTDDDNDGIADENDTLTGNSSFVQSGTITVNVTVNNSINLTQSFNKTSEVVIRDINVTLVNFSFDFSEKTLNLANVTIERQTIANKGSILVRGITLTSGQTKTMYVDNKNTSINRLCIKDAQIDTILEISSDCTGANEIAIACPGTSGSYTCTKVENSTRYRVTGLSFTGIIEQAAPPTEEEEASPAAAAGGGGGGGGGGGAAIPKKITDFSISKNLIKITLQEDKTTKEKIKIKNTGDTTLDLKIDVENIEDFIIFPTGILEGFTLEPGEEKTLLLNFNVPLGQEPGIYTGKVIIISDTIKKVIDVIIEVESRAPLFDVDIEIPPSYQQVLPGDEVLAQIIIFNLRGIGRVDTTIDYAIKDMQGNVIVKGHETVAVETQAPVVRSLKLPSDIKAGKYIFYVKVTYNGIIGSASDLFEIIKPKLEFKIFSPLNILLGVVGIILLLLLVFISLSVLNLLHIHRKEIEKRLKIRPKIEIPKKKVPTAQELLEEIEKTKEIEEVEKKEIIKPLKEKVVRRLKIKPRLTKEKLEEQLKLLEESFKSGLISKEAYNKDKNKINNMLKNLDKK